MGDRGEVLYQFCGDFFPLWIPEKFKNLPEPDLAEDEIRISRATGSLTSHV